MQIEISNFIFNFCKASKNKNKKQKGLSSQLSLTFYIFIGCPEDRFKKICNSIDAKRIKTFKEIDISFTPTESHVFSLDCIDHFHHYCNPQQTSTKSGDMKKMAEKIVSLCSTLGEYPTIRYRA